MTIEQESDRHEDAHFKILRVLDESPSSSQREIAGAVGISLGGVNYCLKALIAKGHIKIENFQESKNKLRYAYVLTPEGISHRAKLAARFIKRKLAEYEAIKAELEQLRNDFGNGATIDQNEKRPS